VSYQLANRWASGKDHCENVITPIADAGSANGVRAVPGLATEVRNTACHAAMQY
jgi:hypothetical protein